jgi:ribose 5-phosphate isomerase A
MARHEAEGGLKLRETPAGEPFQTDGGHLILDAFFGRISRPEALSIELLNIPGVVQHGLFLNMCRKAYIATPNGVETLQKVG